MALETAQIGKRTLPIASGLVHLRPADRQCRAELKADLAEAKAKIAEAIKVARQLQLQEEQVQLQVEQKKQKLKMIENIRASRMADIPLYAN